MRLLRYVVFILVQFIKHLFIMENSALVEWMLVENLSY